MKEVEELEREVSSLQQKILTEGIETSTSKDARKMYGDTTPGDITHQDVTLEYSGFFKHAFRNLPKGLKEDMEKFEIWEMCAEIMKESYEANREDIVDRMINKMKESLLNASGSGSEEDRIDAIRAFTYLLHQIPVEELREKCLNAGDGKEAVDVIMDILTLLPGTEHEKLIHCKPDPPPSTSRPAVAKHDTSSRAQRFCSACDKLLTENELSDPQQVIAASESLLFHVKCMKCHHCKRENDLSVCQVDGVKNLRLVCQSCFRRHKYDLI